MSARDDYPAVATLADAAIGRGHQPEAVRMLYEIERLRDTDRAWMNGVADAVEPFGYNREAACGPADLLPGLATLTERLAERERLAELLAAALLIRGVEAKDCDALDEWLRLP